MAERKTFFEKGMKVMDFISFGVLAIGVLTANSVLLMGSAVDIAGNIVVKQEYRNWKRRKAKKNSS